MKKLFQNNKLTALNCLLLLFLWRIFLFLPEVIAGTWPVRIGYLSSTPWANFDGWYYLSIAKNGYQMYQQAYFPLFPIIIRYISSLVRDDILLSGFIVVYVSLFLLLFLFHKLLEIDYDERTSQIALIFLLFSPAAFFLGGIYTESLFLCLIFASFYAARKHNFFLAGLFACFASATRVIGIFLFPCLLLEIWMNNQWDIKESVKSLFTKKNIGVFLSPLGLIAYMIYLKVINHDPLLFLHTQTNFNNGRTGSKIVLLPQVLYRYIRIFLTVPRYSYDLYIAIIEFSTFLLVCLFIYIAWRKKVRLSYLLFAILAILAPTITGTLSSMPRYALAAFCVFIACANIENKVVKYSILFVSVLLEGILCTLFLRGYFVS